MRSRVTAALLAVGFFALSTQQHGMAEVAHTSIQTTSKFSDLTNFLQDVSGALQAIAELLYSGPSQSKTPLTGHSEASHTTHDLQKALDAILKNLSIATNTIYNIYIPKIEQLGDVVSELEANTTIFLANCQEEYDKQAAELTTCQEAVTSLSTTNWNAQFTRRK